MSNGETPSILRQKLVRSHPQVDDGSPSIEKGLQLAVTKAADKQHNLIVNASPRAGRTCTLAELQATAAEDDLLFCIRCSDGTIGLAQIDLQTRAALIEVQTTGSVFKKAAVDRPVTRTDAKLIEPSLKSILTEFDQLLVDHSNRHWALGYRPSLMLEGPRLIGLVLEDVRYKSYAIDLEIDMGAKSGRITFAFVQDRGTDTVVGQKADLVPFSEKLSESLGNASVELTAVLERITLPLSKIRDFKEGDTVFLTPDATTEIKLLSTDGIEVAVGQLGLNRGHLAVCVQSGKTHATQESDGWIDPQLETQESFGGEPSNPALGDVDEGHSAEPVIDQPNLPAQENSQDLNSLPQTEEFSTEQDFDFDALEDLPELAG